MVFTRSQNACWFICTVGQEYLMSMSESQETLSDRFYIDIDPTPLTRYNHKRWKRKRSVSEPDDLNASIDKNSNQSFVELFCLGRIKGS